MYRLERYRNYIGFWQHKTYQQSTTCAATKKELPYTQYSLLRDGGKKMIKVTNITSERSGRAVANQFILTIDTTVGRVILFQSYDTPIAMTVCHNVHNTMYYIATSERYSVTTSKYQKVFYKKHGESIVRQYSVSNFTEWLEAIHNPALFNALLLQEREKQGVSTK